MQPLFLSTVNGKKDKTIAQQTVLWQAVAYYFNTTDDKSATKENNLTSFLHNCYLQSWYLFAASVFPSNYQIFHVCPLINKLELRSIKLLLSSASSL